ncbi:MAG: polyamine aminopropyltransferase [Pirellulales bacterium]
MLNRAPLSLLYLNVLVIATCGLIYELLAGTLASYVLGDSVKQFSFVIGIYLSAMGVGAWLSRSLNGSLARAFIEIELALALIGGASAPVLFVVFPWIDWFRPLLLGMVFVIGVLVGLELPLLMRILKEHLDFDDLVSRVLTFDYLGALVASVFFPILFVPYLGLVRTSLAFGMLNGLVGLWSTFLLRPLLTERGLERLRWRAMGVTAILLIGFLKADQLTTFAEESVLGGSIIHTAQSPYQRIAVTKKGKGFQLFLNGHLQFNSVDEYRYHEALVHPALSGVNDPKRILILGGGDGLAIRECLKYSTVESITLVDLDPAMTGLSSRFEPLRELNGGAFEDPRVTVINEDAFIWIGKSEEKFDAVIIDFPDPGNYSIGKLYSTRFFRLLSARLEPHSLVSIQCTSPVVAPKCYWCILETMKAAGFHVRPFQASVPSFGIWGYGLACLSDRIGELPELKLEIRDLRFLNPDSMRALFELPQDIRPVAVEINRLDNQVLVRYYDEEWHALD